MVAQLMSIKITTILFLLDITVLPRLFLVICWRKSKVFLHVLCDIVYMNGCKTASLFLYFQVWDGAILVIYGVLVVSWWNYALYVYCHLFMLAKSNKLEESPYAKYVIQGEALFQTHENLEHLAMMERVLGPIPEHMLRRVEWVPFYKCY